MGYERDPDRHLKGVGTIAAAAGKRPRADLRRRQRASHALRNRDRVMAAMTYGPNGGIAGLGRVDISGGSVKNVFSTQEHPRVTGGVVEGGGTNVTSSGLLGGQVNVGSGGGSGGSQVRPYTTGGIRPIVRPPGAGLQTSVPYPGNTGIVPGRPPPNMDGGPTHETSGGTTVVGGGGGGGVVTGGGGGPVIDPIDTDPLPEITDGAGGMSTKMKLGIGIGVAAAAYFLFKKGG